MQRRMQIICLIVIASMISISAAPIHPQPVISDRGYLVSNFEPKNILFDESHTGDGSAVWAPGNASFFSWILGVNGYNSSTNFNQSLDLGILDSYDILAVFFPVLEFSAGEVTAIQSFVTNGGGLLLVGTDGGNAWGFRGTNLNSISEDYGVSFNTDTILSPATTFLTHNLTYGVSDFRTIGDDLLGCSLSLSGPAESIIESSGQTLVAVSEAGLGRVVCVGTPAPFLMYRRGAPGFGDSHFQVSLNVIDWLAGNPQRTANIPEIATITVGNGPDLSPSEVDEYQTFVGLYHDHTLFGDGHNTPEEMVEKGVRIGLDFMLLTEHSYSNPQPNVGIDASLRAKAFVEENGLDCSQFVGAELSASYHTVGFPLTENIFSLDVQNSINQIHAQGGIAVLAHPNRVSSYAIPYENMKAYGYDALEISNLGYFFGSGEEGFIWPFLASSDGHNAPFVGQILNAAFVRNPTGPDGKISDIDFMEAVLDKRIVIIDRVNGFVYGQKVWVEKYFDLWEEAPTAIESARTLVDDLKIAGERVGLSEAYLDAAQGALDWWNPARALRLVSNATSDAALGLDLEYLAPAIVEPDVDFELVLNITSNHTYGINLTSSLYPFNSVDASESHQFLEIYGMTTASPRYTLHSDSYGLTFYLLSLHSFNTTEYLIPILILPRGIIDNVYYDEIANDSGQSIGIHFLIGRASSTQLDSVSLIYNDGEGQKEVQMVMGWDTFDYTIGPFTESTDIIFHVSIVDGFGNAFDLAEQSLTVNVTTTATSSTTTTSTPTTTTPTSPPPPYIPMTIIILGAVVVLGILVLAAIFFRRR